MEPHLLDKNVILSTIIMGFALKATIFVLGFFIVKMGHALVRDGVKGSFTFSTEAKGMKGALQSSSPGLLFVVLGVFVMAYAMFQSKGVDLTENIMDGGKKVTIEQQRKSTDAEVLDETEEPSADYDTTQNEIE